MNQNRCATCGKALVGRVDKKYCSDQCRATANGRIKGDREKKLLDINRILRRNRSILRSLCPSGKVIVEKSALNTLGYSFLHCTSQHRSRDNRTFFVVYDIAFSPLDEPGPHRALVMRWEEKRKNFDPWGDGGGS